ncbi:uncharacterized protein C2orf81 homolog isoform X1 [Corvus hawaiiensis]|uniref:uncharacterized protein C2orf81 homolog isoform X1 n=1 Tax=Corvus hawaiiensis TaxID=134902 RepID=UPI0020198F92|nr:uncharacterized protein C2orf81 homolog isoform X1 [Corvus hawaiiensis]
MYWDELRGHAVVRGGVLVYTGAHWAGPAQAAAAVGVSVPVQKAKPRGAGTKSRRDKSRTLVRSQPRQGKKTSSKSPGRTAAQLTPPDDGGESPPEPLDTGPILDDLLDRVMSECALAAAARQRMSFTVSRARDAILFVAEWRFQVRDDGEPDPEGDPDPERDGVWKEDEEPETCTWDSWIAGVPPIVSRPSEQVPSEDVPVIAEAEGPPECPGEVPDAVPVPTVHPLPTDQVYDAEPPCPEPSAAAEAPPAQVPDAVAVPPVSGPPSPEPPIAPRPPRKGLRLSRPPRPRPAPPSPPRPPAPLPAKPPKSPAQGPQGSLEATAEDGGQVPPLPSSSRTRLASIQLLRPSGGRGVPRLGARRVAARWVVPEVSVVDLMTEADQMRPGASRVRLPPSGSRQVLPGPGRPPRAEPQLCHPWLASARLAPGVTVRWGGSERRGPAVEGRDRQGDGEQKEEAAVRRAEQQLKPILPYPECRMSEHE